MKKKVKSIEVKVEPVSDNTVKVLDYNGSLKLLMGEKTYEIYMKAKGMVKVNEEWIPLAEYREKRIDDLLNEEEDN